MRSYMKWVGGMMATVALLGSSLLYAQPQGSFTIRGRVTDIDLSAQKIVVSASKGVNYVVHLPGYPKMQILAGKGYYLSQPTVDQLAKGDMVSIQVQLLHPQVALTR